MKTAFTMMIVPLLIMAILPIVVGVYVWRDSGRRGMNRPLWTILALFLPGMIGFLIYLLVRSSYSCLCCPQCGEKVEPNFAVCPSCGTRFKSACPGCGQPVEQNWKVCPQCGTQLPEERETLATPLRPKDEGLWKVLALVVVIPLILLVLMIAVGFTSMEANTSALSWTVMRPDEVTAEVCPPEALDWLDEQAEHRSDIPAVLRWKTHPEHKDQEPQVHYMVYLPKATADSEMPDVSVSSTHSPLHNELQLVATVSPDADGPAVLLLSQDTHDLTDLVILQNGKELYYTTTDLPKSTKTSQSRAALAA